jgi:hypothetical protein
MVGGGGVLTCYLVPLILLLISFTHPSPPTPNPPNSPLVGCVAFIHVRSWFGCVLVADKRLGVLSCRVWRVWRSFKLQPFSIALSIFVVADFTGLVKS